MVSRWGKVADYSRSGKTYRQVLDTLDPVNRSEAMYLNPYRRAHGDGSLENWGATYNLELPTRRLMTFYSFGLYNHKFSDAFAFSRNFSARPDRFPTDAGGNLQLFPDIMHRTPDGEVYYNPHIQTRVSDLSWATGLRGTNLAGWQWDLSNTLGYNRFHFYGDKTFNTSNAGSAQTHFDDGGFTFLQNTINLNMSRQWPKMAQGFSLALGLEHRYEQYTIFSGEEASYANFSSGDKASGAQGFPGFQPADEVHTDRINIAGYAEGELDVSKGLLLSGALRVENYSDFGFTHNYKLAARYKVMKNLNVRGSVSTGFRAPSLQQINYSSTFTTVQAGNIAEVKIAPNKNAITRAAGIESLRQERSINASLGAAWSPVNGLSITIDGYWVRIKDRVVLSGQFDGSDPNIDGDLAAAMARLNVSLAQFFTNAVNTSNRGLDLVADYSKQWKQQRVRLLLAANLQKMTIDQINVPEKLAKTEQLRQTFLSDREQAYLLASAPKVKLSFNPEWGCKRYTIGARMTYFGKVTTLGYGEDGLGINPMVPSDADANVRVPDRYVYPGKTVIDIYASVRFAKGMTLQLGADNLFNEHPALGIAPGAKGWAYNTESGGPWDAVQMGGNGRRLFTRVTFAF
ncbi:MAG: hypothetical protein EOO15_17915 [Chitinophagaceae bacterium]|nr:MAG: hypothetical protein EOO15_17915 [Chitinophagaceae bacterium]